MRYRPYIYVLYLFTVVAIICVLTEYASLRINRRDGENIPFLLNLPFSSPRGPSGFSALDPNLGYAHGETEPEVESLKSRFSWLRSFAIYSKKVSQLDRPVILILGGSTTDPVEFGHSWPEELAKIFIERHVSATVINGAAGGYSTNQELIKLIRDGLEFNPDIVISYSGVNDRGDWGEFPNPMVHRYQRYILKALLTRKQSSFLPNTVRLLEKYVVPQATRPGVQGYTLGVDTTKTPGQWYERNLALMHAISEAIGAKFFGIVQPNAFVGGYDLSNFADPGMLKDERYIRKLQLFYSQISTLPRRVDYVRDFTGIFNGVEGVYTDGVHTTTKGEKIIAERMFTLITGATSALPASGDQQ